jgi:hypothetical protein
MIRKDSDTSHRPDPVKVRCPRCQSRLDVLETSSGGRTVSVAFLGASVETKAVALESFMAPDGGVELACPACTYRFDPKFSYTIPPLRRG